MNCFLNSCIQDGYKEKLQSVARKSDSTAHEILLSLIPIHSIQKQARLNARAFLEKTWKKKQISYKFPWSGMGDVH